MTVGVAGTDVSGEAALKALRDAFCALQDLALLGTRRRRRTGRCDREHSAGPWLRQLIGRRPRRRAWWSGKHRPLRRSPCGQLDCLQSKSAPQQRAPHAAPLNRKEHVCRFVLAARLDQCTATTHNTESINAPRCRAHSLSTSTAGRDSEHLLRDEHATSRGYDHSASVHNCSTHSAMPCDRIGIPVRYAALDLAARGNGWERAPLESRDSDIGSETFLRGEARQVAGGRGTRRSGRRSGGSSKRSR